MSERKAGNPQAKQDTPHTVPGRYWHALDDGRLHCDLCPRACALHEGQRGLCFVRGAEQGLMWLYSYGLSSGFCIDPVEKKPLNHFYPGSSVLSFGTAGCNLACKFCQNWDMSKAREMDKLSSALMPQQIAQLAKARSSRSVAFTYNDPVIFLEYAIDTADACHALGLNSIAVTAGYICDAPRREFYAHMDAANVDLKAFSERFYKKICGANLSAVLDTLVFLKTETTVWFEITTLLIPDENDSDAEIHSECAWIAEHLGADVPLHFSAFHPDYKMMDKPPTPPASLTRARDIALGYGLNFVYTGNVHDSKGGTTHCPHCGAPLIVRDWYEILDYRVDAQGCCAHCRQALPGHYAAAEEHFGRRRIPLQILR